MSRGRAFCSGQRWRWPSSSPSAVLPMLPVPPVPTKAQAPPEQPVPPSLEAFAFVGPSLVAGDPAMPDATDLFRRVGIYGGARSRIPLALLPRPLPLGRLRDARLGRHRAAGRSVG